MYGGLRATVGVGTMRIGLIVLYFLPGALWAKLPSKPTQAEIRGQRSEVRDQRSEVGGTGSGDKQGTGGREPAWSPAALSRYEGILARMPFGLPPPPPATPPPAAEPPPPPPPPFANKLTLCAINRTPMGSLAVGFTDGSQTPIRSYYLDVGETRDGFTVVSADFVQECAEITKDGTTVTLWLNVGKRDVKGGAAAAAAPAALTLARTDRKPAVPDGFFRQPNKPAFSNAMEQIMGMIASAPPGTAPPPLPISESDDSEESTSSTLASVIVIHTNDSETAIQHKESVAWIKEDMRQTIAKEGGTSVSYVKRLYERQQAIEKARAEEAEKLRKLAESATREKMQATLDAVNKRLEEQEIPKLGQEEIGITDEDE